GAFKPRGLRGSWKSADILGYAGRNSDRQVCSCGRVTLESAAALQCGGLQRFKMSLPPARPKPAIDRNDLWFGLAALQERWTSRDKKILVERLERGLCSATHARKSRVVWGITEEA